jgi:hypothetical protein
MNLDRAKDIVNSIFILAIALFLLYYGGGTIGDEPPDDSITPVTVESIPNNP